MDKKPDVAGMPRPLRTRAASAMPALGRRGPSSILKDRAARLPRMAPVTQAERPPLMPIPRQVRNDFTAASTSSTQTPPRPKVSFVCETPKATPPRLHQPCPMPQESAPTPPHKIVARMPPAAAAAAAAARPSSRAKPPPNVKRPIVVNTLRRASVSRMSISSASAAPMADAVPTATTSTEHDPCAARKTLGPRPGPLPHLLSTLAKPVPTINRGRPTPLSPERRVAFEGFPADPRKRVTPFAPRPKLSKRADEEPEPINIPHDAQAKSSKNVVQSIGAKKPVVKPVKPAEQKKKKKKEDKVPEKLPIQPKPHGAEANQKPTTSNSNMADGEGGSLKDGTPAWSARDFKVIKKLGRGGFGIVAKALAQRGGRKVALKYVSLRFLMQHNAVHLVNEEIAIQGQLKHPNVVKLHGYFYEKDMLIIIMDIAENGDLFGRIQQHRGLGDPLAARIVCQLAEALDYCHRSGVIHRDLKPENVLLDTQDNALLTDFGWSTRVETGESRMTYCGTIDYQAPEQLLRRRYDKTVDTWALGVLAYEALAGHQPFYPAQGSEWLTGVAHIPFTDSHSPMARALISLLIRERPDDRHRLELVKEHAWVRNYAPDAATRTVQRPSLR